MRARYQQVPMNVGMARTLVKLRSNAKLFLLMAPIDLLNTDSYVTKPG